MGKKISGQGWFAVRIEMRGTRPVAILTGDHFRPDEREIANAVAGVDSKESIGSGKSPVYLVKDCVVDIAFRTSRMKLGTKLVDCHDGLRGKPCGTCQKCKDAMDRIFTRVILGALELPDADLSKRLISAIRNVIGMPWVDAPWSGPMTEEDVKRIFEELGVTPTNEGE